MSTKLKLTVWLAFGVFLVGVAAGYFLGYDHGFENGVKVISEAK